MKTGEMYAYAEQHPKAKFKRMNNEEIYYFNDKGQFLRQDGFYPSTPNLNEEWELIRESVTFMEAVNSGKRIRHEEWNNFHTLVEALEVLWVSAMIAERINGKWHIEEDDV